MCFYFESFVMCWFSPQAFSMGACGCFWVGSEVGWGGWESLRNLHWPGQVCRRFGCGWMEQNFGRPPCFIFKHNKKLWCRKMMWGSWCSFFGCEGHQGRVCYAGLALQVWEVPCSVSPCCNVWFVSRNVIRFINLYASQQFLKIIWKPQFKFWAVLELGSIKHSLIMKNNSV